MLSSVFAKSLYDRRWSILAWNVAAVSLVFYMGGFIPTFTKIPAFREFLEGMPSYARVLIGRVQDLSTPIGWFDSTVYALYAPLFVVIVAIVVGADAVAGEEHRGTLDLLLAAPVSRTRALVEKCLAMMVEVAVLSAAVGGAVLAAARVFSLALETAPVVAATVHLVALGWAAGGIALAGSAWWGDKGRSVLVTTSVLLVGYLLYATAEYSDLVRWLEVLSVFAYYRDPSPLMEGVHWAHVAVLVGIALAGVGLGTVGVNRRDLGVR